MKLSQSFGKKALLRLYSLSTVIIMLSVLLIFTTVSGIVGVPFLTVSNLSVILNQACFLIIVSIGQALVILTGGVNLSMGAVMALSTVVWGDMLLKSNTSGNYLLGCVLVLLTGAVIGLLNGVLITKLKITPYIATFAVMYSCRGLAWVYLRNRVLYPMNESFRVIAMGRIAKIAGFSITVPMLIALTLLCLFYFILHHTNFGRKVYFTGANPIAAKFSGINTDRITIAIHILSSLLAAFAGLMYVARLNAAEPGLANKTHFEAITVSLIGGFVMAGGYGNIFGIAGGAIVVYTIQSGMNSLQLPGEMQMLINGLLIIFAVFLNQKLEIKKMEVGNALSDNLSSVLSK